jgi:hypothetical protein
MRVLASLVAGTAVAVLLAGSSGVALAGGSSPVVTSVEPNLGQGATGAPVVVKGFNFVPGSVLSFPGTGVTVTSTTFVSNTKLRAVVSVAPDAPAGLRGATVTNPNGLSGTCEACFTVDTGPKPASVSPTSGARGATLVVQVLGSDFQDPSKVRFGPGVAVTLVSFVGSGELDVTISISPSARLGSRDVGVLSAADRGRGTCPACFAVTG